ncbi:MAG: rhodanese-like domain-containing protein [Epulopiscium sp.]|nr:rhodanese-like domain-containing protein [Candidatus Epulonipiscium sp.]
MFDFFNREVTPSINVNDINNLKEKINLIDIRESYEYQSGHLPKAKNIPMGALLAEVEKYFDKSQKYYIICQTGGRSLRTCQTLKKKGFDVINVLGGTGGYKEKLK